MEAGFRLRFCWILCLAALGLGVDPPAVEAANQRTQNFLVSAANQQLANAVAEAAERYRRELAVYWTGQELPAWPRPCPIRVVSGPHLAAQGVTTYNPRPVRDFQMEVVGTPQRILDSVLPHEVTHTVLATYFGRPLPRWADEGICTTVEHESEKRKHEAKLREFLSTRRGIAMNRLFLMTEYPPDVLPMYAQGYSVCRFLIGQKGPRTFIQFLKDYMTEPSWTNNVRKHYGYDSLRELQEYWVAWVDAGSGDVARYSKTRPAAATLAVGPGQPAKIARGAPPSARDVGMQTRLAAATTAPAARGTALASVTSDGWYQRRRDEVREGIAQSTSPSTLPAPLPGPHRPGPQRPRTSIAPPSVRDSGRYSVSQPQPEQRMGRSEWAPSRR